MQGVLDFTWSFAPMVRHNLVFAVILNLHNVHRYSPTGNIIIYDAKISEVLLWHGSHNEGQKVLKKQMQMKESDFSKIQCMVHI